MQFFAVEKSNSSLLQLFINVLKNAEQWCKHINELPMKGLLNHLKNINQSMHAICFLSSPHLVFFSCGAVLHVILNVKLHNGLQLHAYLLYLNF